MPEARKFFQSLEVLRGRFVLGSVSPFLQKPVTLTADGAIPATASAVILAKGSAIAATVAAPGASGIGRRLLITSATDFAHVVTFTGATLWDGTATANSTATFGVVQGASIEVHAISATKWNVVSLNAVTPAP